MVRGRKKLSVEEKKVRLIARLEKKLVELKNTIEVMGGTINPGDAPFAGTANLTQTAV